MDYVYLPDKRENPFGAVFAAGRSPGGVDPVSFKSWASAAISCAMEMLVDLQQKKVEI